MVLAENRKRILIIDDDEDACLGISAALEPFYECLWITESTKAMATTALQRPQLILLDYQMPVLIGTDVCSLLKANRVLRDIPVIFISGVATVEDRIRAFECGAMDFITKPFDMRELILRIEARFTRPARRAPQRLSVGNLQLDLLSHRVFVGGSEVFLTHLQFDILKVLVVRQNRLVSRQECMQLVWGQVNSSSRRLDSHMSLLKTKLEKFSGQIFGIHGEGYTLEG